MPTQLSDEQLKELGISRELDQVLHAFTNAALDIYRISCESENVGFNVDDHTDRAKAFLTASETMKGFAECEFKAAVLTRFADLMGESCGL